jgi:phosphopantetheinyl transferase (holo-ACP synthase)
MIVEKEKTSLVVDAKALIDQFGLEKCFSDFELRKYFNRIHFTRLAARFLAKQLICEEIPAIRNMHEISIENDALGKPIIRYSGNAHQIISRKQDLRNIHLSLSHTRKYARALVVFEYA